MKKLIYCLLAALAATWIGSPLYAADNPVADQSSKPADSSGSPTTVGISSLDLSAISQGWGKPQADKSVGGKPMTIAGRSFSHGIGTHAHSEFSIDLGGAATRLTAWAGIDDSAGGKGSATFRVYDDTGKELWSSGVLRGGMEAKQVDMDLSGRRWVTLVVDTGDDGFEFDHADWAEISVTMLSGKPRVIAARLPDPIAELPIAGESRERLATPVRLPFRRELPGPISDWVLMTAEGRWHNEYRPMKVRPVPATGFRYAQRSGRACTGMKAWWMLANRKTGQGLALSLAYMGNWTYEVIPQGQVTVVRLTTSPADLQPITTVNGLPIPGALMAEFTGHWDYGAQPITRFIREKLLRDLGDSWPIVQYNNWYHSWGKVTQKALLDSVEPAAAVGCELFTIDAGWYGKGLDASWETALGDWEVNPDRFPDGIEVVADAVRKAGMKFGLWFEIECAHPDSRLAKTHPDWFLVDSKGKHLGKRDVLDFGKPEVLAHAKSVIDQYMAKLRLDYIKMDFNTDPAIENQDLNQSTDPLFKHYQGLMQLWSYMREKYPDLIIENCASGSLRQELTGAAFTDTFWVSDDVGNDANLLMAFGATYQMPPSICSRWTSYPDRRNQFTDLDAQFVSNMMGHMGLSGAIAKWDEETRQIAARRIAHYKRIRPIVRGADVYHLTPQRLGDMQAALYVDESTGRALVFAFQGGDPKLSHQLRLRGLDVRKAYRIDGISKEASAQPVPGGKLVEEGLNLTFPKKGAALVLELTPEGK